MSKKNNYQQTYNANMDSEESSLYTNEKKIYQYERETENVAKSFLTTYWLC